MPYVAELYEQIGRLKVPPEWRKKKWPKKVREARSWIDFDHEQLSVREAFRFVTVADAANFPLYAKIIGGNF